MRKYVSSIVVLLCMGIFHVVLLGRVGQIREHLPLPQNQGYVLPGQVLRLVAGEYVGLAADFCFLEGLVAYGQTLEARFNDDKKFQEWRRVYRLLDAASDLDPYFFDPYYFANASLTRNPAMVPEINAMLKKGLEKRHWDWMLPFYLGFNYYYYLHDNIKASEYLMMGSKRPNAMPLLTTLAARLAYQGNRTEYAIVFLREILRNTRDEQTRNMYETRLEALEKVHYLEEAVNVYRQRFGHAPLSLQELLRAGIIASIPKDPYGGTFYLADDGSIQTTSELSYAEVGRNLK